MSKATYIKDMIYWAKKAQSATGLPYDFIVAQWSWETDFGTNGGATKMNNHAGIKYSKYSPAGTVKNGMYADYPSMDLFIKDYARVMSLSYYAKIRSAKNDIDRIKELNASPYSEADYNINTMLERQRIAKGSGEGIAVAPTPTTSTSTDYKVSVPNVKGLSSTELEEYALMGLAFSILLSVLPKRKTT